MTHLYDITVIGGGPVGLYATFYAGLRNADVHLIESLPQLGGQVGALYPEKEIYDVAGFPHIKGKDLVTQLQDQMAEFHPTISLNTSVTAIEETQGHYVLKTDRGSFATRAIIIATGKGAFAPRRVTFDYDPDLNDTHVHYFVKDLEAFKNQNIAVAGGGNSALDWAMALSDIAASVTVIHRRDTFRGLESSVNKLQAAGVHLKTPYLMDALTWEKDHLAIGLKKMHSDDHTVLKADHLLINYGFTSDSRILRDWQVKLTGGNVFVDAQMATSRSLIYAVGDTSTYEGKANLIAAGFGEVPTAINHALETIDPQRKQPLHSTSLFQN